MTAVRSLLATAAAVALESSMEEERFVEAARRVFRDATNARSAAPVTAERIKTKIREGALGGRFTARDVYRQQWAGLRDPYCVQLGLDLLVERGQLAEHEHNTGGRPRVEYAINQAGVT